MKLKTAVGQIYLTHPKDENFVLLFEESFSKQGKAVQLFAVIDIGSDKKPLPAEWRREYEKTGRTIVTTFKKTFVAANTLQEETFEKALASVNAALSRLASRGEVKWFGQLHAVLAAFFDNTLALSTTGRATVHLFRKEELNLVSEQAEGSVEPRPVKMFSTYVTGGLAEGDRLLLATHQLFNFLAVERVREFITDAELGDGCTDLIEALADAKTAGFAAFLFDVSMSGKSPGLLHGGAALRAASAARSLMALEKIQYQKTLASLLGLTLSGLKKLFLFLRALVFWLAGLFYRRGSRLTLSRVLKQPRRGRKKLLFAATVAAAVILIAGVAVAAIRNITSKRQADLGTQLNEIESQLGEAEGALIYQDDERALELVTQAQAKTEGLKKDMGKERYQELLGRIEVVKNKVQKQTFVETAKRLVEFANIPTELIYSPNGFLGYNRNTGSMSFYDFRTGETQQLLANENTNRLVLGGFVGGSHGYVFLTEDGRFQKLEAAENRLVAYQSGEPPLPEADSKQIQTLKVFGEGDDARLYLSDRSTGQIYRLNMGENGVEQAQAWLKDSQDLSQALDMAIDGNIYVLSATRLEKFFNGVRQTFALSPTLPELKNAVKVYASPEVNSIYILDPDNKRVLVFDKNGRLKNQLISEEFSTLTDIYPDEKNNIIYILAGSTLLQVDLE